jgi:hypothetical protein
VAPNRGPDQVILRYLAAFSAKPPHGFSLIP